MKIVLFIHGGKVVNEQPIAHFLLRLQAAAGYALSHPDDDVSFVVSGRWTSVTEAYTLTEAEVGKRWLIERITDARVLTEDISVELIGNFAFSKPLLMALEPDRVVILTSYLLQPRTERIAKRIFADDLAYELELITHDQSDNEVLVERESLALDLFEKVFTDIADGDDGGFRTQLLYGTPYYFKGIIDDKDFFESYWQGGFDHYLNGRQVRSQLG